MPIDVANAPRQSPAWWLSRLSRHLDARRPELEMLDAYYAGNQTIKYAMERWRKAFARQFRRFTENCMPLVVDSVEERIDIIGFAVDEKFDDATWKIWKRNHMDSESQIAHTESLTLARAYALVWNTEDSAEKAQITVESPYEVIVEHVPGSRWARAAAAKVWLDELSGKMLATVYLPDGIWKFQSERAVEQPYDMAQIAWEERFVEGETRPIPNPLGVVPVVPLYNRPRLGKSPRSEMADVLSTQDAINKLSMDLLVASEFAAFRQRYIIGAAPPLDPKTGQYPDDYWKQALEEFLIIPKQGAQVGSIEATDLKNYVVAIEHEIQQVATRTKTPPHYFFLRGEFPSGESIVAAEAGLISKARRRMTHWEDAWSEVMQLARTIENRAKTKPVTVLWSDPESRTENQHIDAVGKKRTMLEVPLEVTWADAGYTPAQIQVMKEMHAAEKAAAARAAARMAQPATGDQGAPAGEQEE